MQSIIQQFFDGNIADNELMIKEHSPERIKRLDKLDELEQALEEKLSEEQKKLFEEYKWTNSEDWSEEVSIAYERGFRMGSLLIMQIVQTQI